MRASAGVVTETQTLPGILAGHRGETPGASDTVAIWTSLAAAHPVFAGVKTFSGIPREGLALDAGNLAELDFPETRLLKFTPAAPALV